MLQLDRRGAARYITDAKGIDLLFDGAPRQREPSGVMEASVAEMPIVELAPGEFTPLPIGGVAEGVQTPNRRCSWAGLVRLNCRSWSRRTGSEWKVEPLPYFALMEQ